MENQDARLGRDPQGMDRLFDAFYATESNGIGLSGSRSIIEKCHGRLWQHSTMVTELRFHFPFPADPRVGRAPTVLAPCGRLL